MLEPAVARLTYINAGHMGPFYAQVGYRFKLVERDGAPIATWMVRGSGQYDPRRDPGRRTEREIVIEAPRRAVETSIVDFVHSFERVPELMRWAAGRAITGADAASNGQVMRPVPAGHAGVEAGYPGVLTLLARREALPRPPGDVAGDEPAEPPLVPVRLTLRNESARRLALAPADIDWIVRGATRLEPLPGDFAAALVTGPAFGMTVAVMGPGLAALPALFAALATAASHEQKKKELAAWSDAIARDLLKDSVIKGGDSSSGLVYFSRPPGPHGGELVVRVVDLDEAVRYTVRVPFPSL